MAIPLVKISYKNVSGSDIPPFGIIQLTGPCIPSPNGDLVVQAAMPGVGTGPYMIDDGKGSAASGEGQYGSCSRAVDGLCWVAYGCTAPPDTPWQKVGPVTGSPFVSTAGDGYFYGGIYDGTNSRILCLMSTFSPIATTCSSSSSSSPSSSSGSRVSSSSSSSSPCGCVNVVVGVSCIGNSLAVSMGTARACC